MRLLELLLAGAVGAVSAVGALGTGDCQFARRYSCDSFKDPAVQAEYLRRVMKWEGQFAQPGVAFDPRSGYTYDGHPINYTTGELFGEPHFFSAPSKESIHVAVLALAIDGNENAQLFAGGADQALAMLQTKVEGYESFNKRFPGFGCFTPWVGFDAHGFSPLESWANKVPGLDNGEWFWALYAVAHVLREKYGASHAPLAERYARLVRCQQASAKAIFYRGNGDVSAVANIRNTSAPVTSDNYFHGDGYLNDPYEGETMTQLLFLFADWDSEAERQLLWEKKRGLFQKAAYQYTHTHRDDGTQQTRVVTVQQGFWFSSHEQWKTLLMPYLDDDLPLVQKVFLNAEKVRALDMHMHGLPGMMASINDVTNGSQDIPDYASACGVPSVASQPIERRDLLTPYGAYALFLHDTAAGLCWYNNMLQGPRMQSKFGSIEAINANATEISPLTTWDSKITTVLAMLGGIGPQTKSALRRDAVTANGRNAYAEFVDVVAREHALLFGDVADVLGDDTPLVKPSTSLAHDQLADWDIQC